MRLQRFLAQAGIASRRKSEDLIAAGLVTVNGQRVTGPGTTVDPERDVVTLRGRVVRPRRSVDGIVVALHKPPGFVTARGGAGTVYDLVVEPPGSRLVYVGRLDRDSEGLLLLTTDGELAHRLTHPSREIERVYEAWITGPLDERTLVRGARSGIVLEDGERTAPFRARVLEHVGGGAQARQRVELILTEGKKREVRRIVAACGGRVDRLVRTRYGPVALGRLAPGSWRNLRPREVARLRAAVGLATGAEGGR
jgi:23S rRNA pseudouridine2605 synthase